MSNCFLFCFLCLLFSILQATKLVQADDYDATFDDLEKRKPTWVRFGKRSKEDRIPYITSLYRFGKRSDDDDKRMPSWVTYEQGLDRRKKNAGDDAFFMNKRKPTWVRFGKRSTPEDFTIDKRKPTWVRFGKRSTPEDFTIDKRKPTWVRFGKRSTPEDFTIDKRKPTWVRFGKRSTPEDFTIDKRKPTWVRFGKRSIKDAEDKKSSENEKARWIKIG